MKKITIPNIELNNNYFITEDGKVWSERSNKFLSPTRIDKGYLRYSLQTKQGQKKFMAHRLVMMTYSPISNSEKMQVNHIDGNKENNSLSNLEWCDGFQNMRHAFDSGLKVGRRGENSSSVILTEKQVFEIIKLLLDKKLSLSEIGKLYGVSKGCVFDIKRKKSWKYLTETIDFK